MFSKNLKSPDKFRETYFYDVWKVDKGILLFLCVSRVQVYHRCAWRLWRCVVHTAPALTGREYTAVSSFCFTEMHPIIISEQISVFLVLSNSLSCMAYLILKLS